MKRELRSRISDAKGLLDSGTVRSPPGLAKLIDQPLQFEVFDENGAQGYRITGKGNYLGLDSPGCVDGMCRLFLWSRSILSSWIPAPKPGAYLVKSYDGDKNRRRYPKEIHNGFVNCHEVTPSSGSRPFVT